MITIQTTIEHESKIIEYISSVDQLEELVNIALNDEGKKLDSNLILIENGLIKQNVDWYDREPPMLFSELIFDKNNFLGLVFYKLGNHQMAFEYITVKNEFYNDLLTATHLQFGYQVSEEMYSKLDSYHNRSIVQHYAVCEKPCTADDLSELYRKAIKNSENDECKLFTAKHYTNFLIDKGAFSEAEELIRKLQPKAISREAKINLDVLLASAMMAQLKMPYETATLKEILYLFKKGVEFYESKGQQVNAGLLYIEASEVANFDNDFVASKDLINKAISIFKEADIPEFLGEAGFRKATLLYTWSKNGSPQYYKPAINAFQDTLKVFKKETHPQKFADVHHKLALIYSEIPVSSQEKAIWTAFCASSFKEVLHFYNKDEYPYEFAMASHNYATALLGFPEAKLHNNLNKANRLFEDALSIRTKEDYPFERALTLANQLELYWVMHNNNNSEETENYNNMLNKANEIKVLVGDKTLIQKADEHLEALKKLKTILN